MVEVTVMIEGGAIDANRDVATIENTESLRQSFHRIFSELLGNEVKITVQPLAGYRNAARIFTKLPDNKNVCLYVDLDDKKENIPHWFDKLKPIVIAENKKAKIFFMIQEMEAWILKQPDKLDIWGKENNFLRTNSNEKIEEHPLIVRKNIEDISKPSKILYEIIKHFFAKEYNSKKKKIQYGKLKTAPGLLDCLDVKQLKKTDSEIDRFCQHLIE